MRQRPLDSHSILDRRRGSRLYMKSALAGALAGAMACASAADALLDQATGLHDRHDAAAAFERLAAAEDQRAGEPRFDYLLGIAALDSGHVTRAIFALERLVEERPGDALAHAELGRAYLAAGDPEAARVQLAAARARSLPDGASAAIDRVIDVIDHSAAPAGRHVAGYVEAGIGYDSNVNSATNQGEFAIPGFGGIVFATAPESRRRGDAFASVGAGVNAEFDLSPAWKLVAATNLHASVNRQAHDMQADLLDATLALRRTAGDQSATVALQDGTAWVGSRLYRTAAGASAQWQAQVDAHSQLSVFGQWSSQAYHGEPERDTGRTVLGGGYAHDFGQSATLVYGSAYVVREQARRAEFAHFGQRALGLRLGVERGVTAEIVAFAEWQHEQRRYGGSEPFFERSRRDREDDVSVGLRYSLGDRWQLLPQVRYTRAQSNVVLYDYVRTVFQVTAHRSFQ